MGEAKTETAKEVRTRRTELNLTMLQLCTRDSCTGRREQQSQSRAGVGKPHGRQCDVHLPLMFNHHAVAGKRRCQKRHVGNAATARLCSISVGAASAVVFKNHM